jgi:glycine/serine hydroxymethyltransferase
MTKIADLIKLCADSEEKFEANKDSIIEEVDKLTKEFPLYNK